MNYAGLSSHEGFFFLSFFLCCIPLFSISSLTLLHSLVHSFKLIFSSQTPSISFTLNHVSQKTASLPPPRLPTLLLFCSLLHPLTLFPALCLCLDVIHTHTHTLYSHGWSAEQRWGGGPVLCVSDSHKCVKEEKRKSSSLSSVPAARVSLLKKPVTNVRVIWDRQIVRCL